MNGSVSVLAKSGQRRRERAADLLGLRLDVGVEERAAHDREGQARHLLRDVPRLAVLPARRGPRGVLRHHAPVALDALVVEGRLHHAALAQVLRVLARQQPVAEQAPGALEPAALVEGSRVRDEEVPDPLGPVEQVDLDRAHPESRDVAVLPGSCVRNASGSRRIARMWLPGKRRAGRARGS